MWKVDTILMVVEVAFHKSDYSQNLWHLCQRQTLRYIKLLILTTAAYLKHQNVGRVVENQLSIILIRTKY